MNLEEYIELDRQFIELSDRDIDLVDIETKIASGYYKLPKWPDLLQSYRVVLLSSAGTGKSWEVCFQCLKLIEQGYNAFYIRLEDLAEGFSDTVFEQGNIHTLQNAMKCRKEIWLFLDSIDEARLSDPRKFELALKKLQPEIKNHLQKTHLILTSRVGAWRPTDDANQLNNLFPHRNEEEQGGNDNAPSSPIKYYTLRPLTSEQMVLYAQGKQVENAETMIDDIVRKQMADLAGRPKDLDDIVLYWKSNEQLGTRLEMVKDSIKRKLNENDPDRSARDRLTLEKAYEGATKLAASVVLSHQGKIIIPGNREQPIDGIIVNSVLKNWLTSECNTLLGRPIFEPETYGFVRFDHRDSKEFLAAEWFLRLISIGQRWRVEALFFKQHYGVDIVVPSLRSILPWIALCDQQIRNRLIKNWPEILLEGGDPTSLPFEDRKSLLTLFCDKVAKTLGTSFSIDQNTLQRLVSNDMSQVIRSLVNEYADHHKITRLLIRSIELGLLTDLSDIAIKMAEAEKQEEYIRLVAMRAVNVVAPEEKIYSTVQTISKKKCLTNRRMLAHFINSFDHKYIPSGKLVKLICNVDQPIKHKVDGLNHAIQTYISVCSLDALEEIVEGIAPYLKSKPFIERGTFEDVSKDHAWMLNFAIPACERLVKERHQGAFSESALSIISLVHVSIGDGILKVKTNLPALISPWSELNESLFWHDVVDVRRIMQEKDESKLTDWSQVRSFRPNRRFDREDFDLVISWITKKPLQDDKLVALSLAFNIYCKAGRQRKLRDQLWKRVKGNEELSIALKKYMNPPRQTAKQKKYHKLDARLKRKMARRKAKLDDFHQKWKRILPKQLAKIRNEEKAKKDYFCVEQKYLFERMKDKCTDQNLLALTNWVDLIEEFGIEVAEAMRDGLKSTWRNYKPGLPSEGTKIINTVTDLEVMGLSGLAIEASEYPDWPSTLSTKDAYLAARYLMSELVGFPEWFEAFAKHFPEITHKQIVAEIEWELSNSTSDQTLHYILSDIFYYTPWYEVQIAPDVHRLLNSNDPRNLQTLKYALNILLRCNTITDQKIAELAIIKANMEALDINQKPLWYAAWVSVKPESAIVNLKDSLRTLDKDKTKDPSSDSMQDPASDFAISFINALNGTRFGGGLGVRENYLKAQFLVELYELMHKYIRKEEDLNRYNSGVFTPTSRDEAQDGRERLYNALCDTPGIEAFNALVNIAESAEGEYKKTWLYDKAYTRARADADQPWNINQINEFEETLELVPTTPRELFDVAINCLLDFKYANEEGDNSPSNILKKVDNENELRNYLAGELVSKSQNRFSISQEHEFPNMQRTDIRFMHASILGMVPVELKIANKWSGNKLLSKLRGQLCLDYLCDPANENGIYLLIYCDKTEKNKWKVSGEEVDFKRLVEFLQEYANNLIQEDHEIREIGVTNLRVIGIDLTKRAVTHQGT